MYTGTDNLEAMQLATNYNAYLVKLVLDAVAAEATVLDFGAGTGTFAQHVRQAGHRVVCVEPDPELRGRLGAAGFEVHGDVSGVPSESVDCAFTLNVLEHIEDDAKAVRELRRVIKPGGSLLVYVPAMRLLWTSMDTKVGHFRRYESSTLAALLRSAAFDVAELRYVDSLGVAITLLYKLLGSRRGDLNVPALVLYDRVFFPLSVFLDRFVGRLMGKNALAVAKRH
jgi:SAM-dependent methyltransferase